MKILVSGSHGFVGGRLCEALKSDSNLQILSGTRKVETKDEILMDWTNVTNLESACEGVDVVIHLAALNSKDCLENSKLAFEVNVTQTKRLLEAACNQKVKRFIYLSTAHVYSQFWGIVNEKTALQDSHPYATTHRSAEILVLNEASEEMSSIVLRMSNSYGAPVRDDTKCWSLLINDLCRQAIELKKFKLNSNGKQYRNFISMTDACCAIKHCINLKLNEVNSIFNLGSNWNPSILEVAQWIGSEYKKCYGKEIPIEYPNDDMKNEKNLYYDSSKLADTGFVASTSPEFELHKLFEYCERNFLSKA
jgi:UDP-glucose 4-epimerase